MELKYRDFVPNFLGLADCQDKIQQLLQNSDDKLKNIETQLTSVDKELENLKNEVPHKKKEIVTDFINRLSILNEIEQHLNSLWLLPDNKVSFNPLENSRVILRLEDLSKSLQTVNTVFAHI